MLGFEPCTNAASRLPPGHPFRSHCDHLVRELAHRRGGDLHALAEIEKDIALGDGVIDRKIGALVLGRDKYLDR